MYEEMEICSRTPHFSRVFFCIVIFSATLFLLLQLPTDLWVRKHKKKTHATQGNCSIAVLEPMENSREKDTRPRDDFT